MNESRVSYDITYISNELSADPNKTISNAENFYSQQIKDTVNSVGSHKIILLSGPSGSGKTTTANKICEGIRNYGHRCEVVSLDDFYHNRENLPIINGKVNAEVVEALKVSLIHKTIENLISTGRSSLPKYDFFTGIRTDDATEIDVGSDGIVIFEGIHALNPKINKGINKDDILEIYVSPHSGFMINDEDILTKREARFIRRLVRDSWSRNTAPEKTMAMWPVVCEGEDTLIRPFSGLADIRINTTHSYEPFLMKNKAISLLSSIQKENEYFDLANKYIVKLNHFTQIDISLLPKDSLLREFINPSHKDYI